MNVDWSSLFALNVPPLELVVRGTVMYWALFLLFRYVMRRAAGALGIADLLFVVIIADASQNAFAGEYSSIAEGMVLVATLVGWNRLMDWVSWRYARVARLLEPPPVLLIRDGKVVRRHLRDELMSVDDLASQLRQQGVSNLSEVAWAYMESDGHVSVGRRDPREVRVGGRPPGRSGR